MSDGIYMWIKACVNKGYKSLYYTFDKKVMFVHLYANHYLIVVGVGGGWFPGIPGAFVSLRRSPKANWSWVNSLACQSKAYWCPPLKPDLVMVLEGDNLVARP